MKTFFKDYWKLCKQSGEFYKKHWLGTIVFTGIVTCVTYAPFIIKGKKDQKKFEEELNKELDNYFQD